VAAIGFVPTVDHEATAELRADDATAEDGTDPIGIVCPFVRARVRLIGELA
jgi:hypothetical protein